MSSHMLSNMDFKEFLLIYVWVTIKVVTNNAASLLNFEGFFIWFCGQVGYMITYTMHIRQFWIKYLETFMISVTVYWSEYFRWSSVLVFKN